MDMLQEIHLGFYPIMSLAAGVFSNHSYSLKVMQFFISFHRGQIRRESLFLVALLVKSRDHFLIESNAVEAVEL